MVDPMEQFLNRLHHPALAQIDLKLDRMLRLLSMLGNPHKRVPPVIHVAGTNGKGSLIAYLRAIFEAAGLRVHVYTSPHLVEFRERIVLSGRMIENAQVAQIAHHIARILEQQPATFFEATTALAFLAFAQSKADILLLETGMGGRLDCTNVIDKPLLTAITPIALDHTEFLGDTVAKIAEEKAGIMKQGVACVVGRQTEEVMAVLYERAAAIGVPIVPFKMRELPAIPALLGAHQLDNAVTALACIEQLPQFSITQAHIAQGLANVVWPGRLQRLTHGGYVQILPVGMECWLDGGHNPQGAEVLAAWLAEKNMPTYVVCGMVGSKDASGYMQAIAPWVKGLWAVAIPHEEKSKKPAEIAVAARNAGIVAKESSSIEHAFSEIASIAETSALVLIAGSLYLAGFILKTNR